MARRKWTITPQSDGTFTVRCPGEGTRTASDEEAALSHVRKRFRLGDTVLLAEKDGYLIPITRRITR